MQFLCPFLLFIYNRLCEEVISPVIKWEKRWTWLIRDMFKPNDKGYLENTFRRLNGSNIASEDKWVIMPQPVCTYSKHGEHLLIPSTSADLISAEHHPWSCWIDVINSSFIALWFCLYLPRKLVCLCSCIRAITIRNISLILCLYSFKNY